MQMQARSSSSIHRLHWAASTPHTTLLRLLLLLLLIFLVIAGVIQPLDYPL
jgi:hypothetical protein